MKSSEKFVLVNDGDKNIWKFTDADAVSKIMPHLLLSSHVPTGDEKLLRAEGITHILSIGHLPSKTFPDITYSYFDVSDDPKFEIKSIFKDCFKVIEEARAAGGAVLVHCNVGVSRSPTVVIAYLMMKEKMSVMDAFARVRMARRLVNPNEGFLEQLRDFEKDLKGTE